MLFNIGNPQILKIHVNKNKFVEQFKIEQNHAKGRRFQYEKSFCNLFAVSFL